MQYHFRVSDKKWNQELMQKWIVLKSLVLRVIFPTSHSVEILKNNAMLE